MAASPGTSPAQRNCLTSASVAEPVTTQVVSRRLAIPACGWVVLLAGFLTISLSLYAQRPASPLPNARAVAPNLTPNDPSRIRPLPATAALAALVGEYGAGADTIIVLERGGRIFALRNATEIPIAVTSFARDSAGRPIALQLDAQRFPRRSVGTEEGITFHIVPAQSVDVLRRLALSEQPPVESGHHRRSDLTDVAGLDDGIKLDIRYATANNFMGAPMYSSARAFLQRPAAEALVRAHRALAAYGFGLLIHDAYRPWYVTRMFWDATTGADRGFVANPATGSKHNRGAAVDLTLYERSTGAAVRMTGGYDEFSERSYAQYPGGTALQRWTRDLLRRVMERQGFTVNPSEWWHFDYEHWREYPLLNTPFETIGRLRR